MEELFPSLSLCICVRNGESLLDRCLNAIAAQINGDPAVPIIVVNHLSTDNTGVILEDWRKRLPTLQIIGLNRGGLADARNAAFQAVKTDWFAFIDVDCEIQQNWLVAVRRGIEAFHSKNKIAGFGGNNRLPLKLGGLYPAYDLFLSHFIGGHSSILNREVSSTRLLDHIPTLNVAYRTSALEQIGGFDPLYKRVGEDLDLSFRLRAKNYELWALPGMVVEHAIRPTLKAWIKNMFLYGKGRVFFTKNHPESMELKFLAPFLIFVLYVALLGFAIWKILFLEILAALTFFHLLAIFILLIPNAITKKSDLKTLLVATYITWLTHLTYGAGMMRELC